ncbi:MAG: hypothetical protein IIZ04_01055, partial [Aeriscardovia sp.]|nr:hypothetical protein [Aeriscardovia sp.]
MPLDDVEKVLKNEWQFNLSPSRNLGVALQKRIKAMIGPGCDKVNVLLSSDDVEDFIDPSISKYVRSHKGAMAYLAALYPSKEVLVNTQLFANPEKKSDLFLLSLSKEAAETDCSAWDVLTIKLCERTPAIHFARPGCGYDPIKKIKHLKVTAKAHLDKNICVFNRNMSEWGTNFTFERAILRLCNLQDMPFRITKKPNKAFQWRPLINSGGEDERPVLSSEVFGIYEATEIEMEGNPDLLC